MDDEMLSGSVVVAGAIALYLLPAIIAGLRGHDNAGSIMVVNLFLGWTLVGYVVALAWSMAAKREPVVVSAASPVPEKTQPSSIERECPICGEFIKKVAIKCRFCGADLQPPGFREPHF